MKTAPNQTRKLIFGLLIVALFAARVLIYALIASSLNLLIGYGGMVSFGHAAFVGAGAYTVAMLMPSGIASRGSSEKWSASCRCFLFSFLGCRLLAALRGLGAEFLGEALDAAFGIEKLLTSGEERVAIRADFEV